MVLAVACFAVMNVLVKLIPDIGAVEIVFVRSVVSFIMSFFMLKRIKVNVWGNNKPWLILRGVVGSVGLISFFYTIQVMPLASAVSVNYLSPIFTIIIGIYLVKEKVWPMQWVFFALAFTGVLIIQGWDTRVDPLSVVVGIVGAFFAGFAYNCVKRLKTTEHPLVIVLYFPLVTIPVTGLYLLNSWVMPSLYEWAILIGIGVATQFAQYFLTKAYQTDAISKIASIQYVGIVFAILLGWIFFDETYTWVSGSGIIVLAVGVSLNIWYKTRKQVQERNS